MTLRIGFASDHAGFQLKEFLKPRLVSSSEVVDVGTGSDASVDYPDFAHALAYQIENNKIDLGIAICGSGIGMSIALNRHEKIRAALVWDEFTAKACKEHNNANVLCLGSRTLSPEKALVLVEIWLNTKFEGGRHERRIEKLSIRKST